MSNDTLPNDLDGLRALVAQLASEHEAAIAESRRLTLPAVPRTVMSPLELDRDAAASADHAERVDSETVGG